MAIPINNWPTLRNFAFQLTGDEAQPEVEAGGRKDLNLRSAAYTEPRTIFILLLPSNAFLLILVIGSTVTQCKTATATQEPTLVLSGTKTTRLVGCI